MQHKPPLSETLGIGACLAFVGGFLEAYTYILRGGVFANAQTGNLALLAIHAARGNFSEAAYYLVPISAFFLGVCVTEFLKQTNTQQQWVSWEHIVIGLEAALLLAIGFLPLRVPDAVVNVAVSLICSMQTNSFRKVHGLTYATTMCTGNLRSASEHLFRFLRERDRQAMRDSARYLAVISLFGVGCLVGTMAVQVWAERSVWICCIILAGVFLALRFCERGKER